jgi:hypothetical protein
VNLRRRPFQPILPLLPKEQALPNGCCGINTKFVPPHIHEFQGLRFALGNSSP